MNSVSNQQSLQRILASPSVSKYATVSKFLAGKSPVAAQPDPTASTMADSSTAAADLSVTSAVPSVQTDLDLLDNLVEQTLLNRPVASPAVTSNRAKETLPVRNADQMIQPEQTTVEVSPEINADNQESVPNTEMQELSKELQEVSKETKEQREQALIAEKQRAINDLAAASTTPVAIDDKPVVVLPITAASKEEAKFKTTAYSVKWLWQWCQKIAKMFAGAVVYKEEIEEA